MSKICLLANKQTNKDNLPGSAKPQQIEICTQNKEQMHTIA